MTLDYREHVVLWQLEPQPWVAGMKKIILLCLIGLLAACHSDEQRISIPVQHWKNMDVRIETHPNPPLAGMSDMVVIVTGLRGKPISDLTVSLRSDDTAPWVQAIQDGFIGVYRRALDLGDKDPAVVRVKIQQGDDQTVLKYPIRLSANQD